ncbi:hypothetical protein FB645_000589 [Coemansia sp. IMI 203386]|nr:hypothetical protein FB645_000589 [Coemansia sp. IMI 203386]
MSYPSRSRPLSTFVSTPDILIRQHKTRSPSSAMSSNHISLFKLTTSAGNGIEQPIRPGEQFSGVLAIQVARPIPASQIVLEMSASERVVLSPKNASKAFQAQLLSAHLVVWKAVRKGTAVSTVLSDGIHVFNFSCTMPYLNYPQTNHQAEFDFFYKLEGKLVAPRDGGGEQVVATVQKELFFTPIVTRLASPDPLLVVETLYFEKKGKKGKPAIELRAAISGHQMTPGSKVRIELSIKELASAGWTKAIARLFERTVCRQDPKSSFSHPIWSVDRELVSSEIVRSSVYNFFLNDDLLSKKGTDSKTADGETTSTENVTLSIPLAPCGHLSSEHLDFSHFIRLEVHVPSWLSSDRSVHVDIPVQMMTFSQPRAARIMKRQGSITNLERISLESDAASIMSGGSNAAGTRPQSCHSSEKRSEKTPWILSHEICAAIVNSLPPRYCDVHPVQRASPTLVLLNQANAGTTQDSPTCKEQQSDSQYSSRQSKRSTRHTTMSSLQSFETRTVMSSRGNSEESCEPMSGAMSPIPSMLSIVPPMPLPPPLPSAPMPKDDVTTDKISLSLIMSASASAINLNSNSHQLQVLSPAMSNVTTPVDELSGLHISLTNGLTTTQIKADQAVPGLGPKKKRQNSDSSVGHPLSPVSPTYVEDTAVDASSDEDAGYFKSSNAKKSLDRERPAERGLFRLRKNSSIKYAI